MNIADRREYENWYASAGSHVRAHHSCLAPAISRPRTYASMLSRVRMMARRRGLPKLFQFGDDPQWPCAGGAY